MYVKANLLNLHHKGNMFCVEYNVLSEHRERHPMFEHKFHIFPGYLLSRPCRKSCEMSHIFQKSFHFTHKINLKFDPSGTDGVRLV